MQGGEVVADGVQDGFVHAAEGGEGLRGGDVGGEFVLAVEEELEAAETRGAGGGLEAPSVGRRGGVFARDGLAGGRGGAAVGLGVGDLGGDLVGGDAVPAGPGFESAGGVSGGR